MASTNNTNTEIEFLDNDPEFIEFLKKNEASEESDKQLDRLENLLLDQTMLRFDLLFYMLQNNIGKQGNDSNQENLAPTSSKATNCKRIIRNSNVKRGKKDSGVAMMQSILLQPDSGTNDAINNDLSQELEEKVKVSCQPLTDQKITAKEISTIPRGKVRIQVLSDPNFDKKSPHEGEIYIVEPSGNASKICKIGRSCGKEYTEFGISLHKDNEVSTKHGMLTGKVNKGTWEYYFTDTGSSNGTVDDKNYKLEVNENYKLANGTKLRLGSSVLLFNFST